MSGLSVDEASRAGRLVAELAREARAAPGGVGLQFHHGGGPLGKVGGTVVAVLEFAGQFFRTRGELANGGARVGRSTVASPPLLEESGLLKLKLGGSGNAARLLARTGFDRFRVVDIECFQHCDGRFEKGNVPVKIARDAGGEGVGGVIRHGSARLRARGVGGGGGRGGGGLAAQALLHANEVGLYRRLTGPGGLGLGDFVVERKAPGEVGKF